jgi:hypothetical protein
LLIEATAPVSVSGDGWGLWKTPPIAKQNDCDSTARHFAYFQTKLLKQGFDVHPLQATAYRSGEDQLKDTLVLAIKHCTASRHRCLVPFWFGCFLRIK